MTLIMFKIRSFAVILGGVFELAACSSAPLLGNSSVGAKGVPVFPQAARLPTTTKALDSIPMGDVIPEAVREAYHKCEPSGGNWKIPTIGSRVKGNVQYGENDCPKGSKISITSNANPQGGNCGPEDGYINSGIEIEFNEPSTLTFSGTGGLFTVESRDFKAGISYTFFLLDAIDNQTLFQVYIGSPRNSVLTFSSPFQAGFRWPNGDSLGALICSQ